MVRRARRPSAKSLAIRAAVVGPAAGAGVLAMEAISSAEAPKESALTSAETGTPSAATAVMPATGPMKPSALSTVWVQELTRASRRSGTTSTRKPWNAGK